MDSQTFLYQCTKNSTKCLCPVGFFGKNCNLIQCPSNNSTYCALITGKCESGSCICNSTHFGPNCYDTTCFGKNQNDPSVCSSNGICNDFNQCICNEKYYGYKCKFFILSEKEIFLIASGFAVLMILIFLSFAPFLFLKPICIFAHKIKYYYFRD